MRRTRVSTPVVVVPTWAKRGFGALPRCSLDDVKGELAVARGLRCPTARPLDDLERKLAFAQSGHHEAPPLIGRVGLVVAPAAERHQLVQVEVRSALRAIDHMVDVECRQ